MSVPTTSWDETSPAGSQARSLGDDRIRELKTQIREIINVDHDFPSSGQAADNGQHKKVTLQEQADLGTGAAGATLLGSQTVDGKGELVYTDEDDNDIQLTSKGVLLDSVNAKAGDLLSSSVDTARAGWTDVTATYNGKFQRISTGTALATGGADSHTHTGGAHTHTGPSHTHTGPSHTHDQNYGSNGGGTDETSVGNCIVANAATAGTTIAVGTGSTSSNTKLVQTGVQAAGTGNTGASGTGDTGSGGAVATSSGDNVPAYFNTKLFMKD